MKNSTYFKKKKKNDRVALRVFFGFVVCAIIAWFVANLIHLNKEGDKPIYFVRVGEWSTLSLQTVALGILILVLVILGIQTLLRRQKK